MPYEWNWSQDVENCTLDLVSSYSTHTNAIQTIALASKGGQKFLQDPLAEVASHVTVDGCYGRRVNKTVITPKVITRYLPVITTPHFLFTQ